MRKQLFDYVEKWDNMLYFAYNIIAKIKYFFLKKKIKNILNKNLELKDSFHGRRCFIVLNGPSINDHDLTRLENEYVICSNHFYESRLAELIKPNLFCILDSKELVTERGNLIIREILSKFPEGKLVLNIKGLNEISGSYKNVYFTYNKHLPYKGHIKNDLNRMCSGFKTVAFYAINIAIYMGFSELYILGLDFEPTGFSHYDDIPGAMKKLNKINDRHAICDHYWAYSQQHAEAYAISDYAKQNNTRIINLNEDSYIRAFEFGVYENINLYSNME